MIQGILQNENYFCKIRAAYIPSRDVRILRSTDKIDVAMPPLFI